MGNLDRRPGKIVCVGRNYAAHARELGNEIPAEPLLFLKPPSAVIENGGAIVLPPESEQVEHEAEIAVVIGQRARDVSEEDALSYVAGYAPLNDVTARDLQKRDVQFTRAKGYDTFCPIGPWIETELDPSELEISSTVDGEPRRAGNTRDLIHKIPDLIAYISDVWTLLPGDIILTGTPSGLGGFLDGQTVDITIEGIGTLSNPARYRDGAPLT